LLFFTIFIGSLRVSETLASYVSTIPGRDKIVEIVRQDKGLVSIIENDYVQEVMNSDTHHGITIALHSFIADEEQLVLFYSVKTEEETYEDLQIEQIRLENDQGEVVPYNTLSIEGIDASYNGKICIRPYRG
jgi:hypothetical protein